MDVDVPCDVPCDVPFDVPCDVPCDVPFDFTCRRVDCDLSFRYKGEQLGHERICKSGNLPDGLPNDLTCPNAWCGKAFGRVFNLLRHEQNCFEKEEKSYPCDICGKTFGKPSKLKRHMKTHDMKPLFSCPECEKVYERKDKYAKHVQKCKGGADSAANSSLVSMVDISSSAGMDGEAGISMVNMASCTSRSGMQLGNVADSGQNADTIFGQLFSYANNDVVQGGDDSISEKEADSDVPYVLSNDGVDGLNNLPADESLPEPIDIDEQTLLDEHDHMSILMYYKLNVAEATITKLKTLKRLSRNSSVKHMECAKLCKLLFAEHFENPFFITSLAADLGFANNDDFFDFINFDQTKDLRKPGRPPIGKTKRQHAYDHWLESSYSLTGVMPAI